MRYTLHSAILVVVLCLSLFAVSSHAGAGPSIAVTESIHDFGEVWEGTELKHAFTVQNKGDEPLIIEKVPTS